VKSMRCSRAGYTMQATQTQHCTLRVEMTAICVAGHRQWETRPSLGMTRRTMAWRPRRRLRCTRAQKNPGNEFAARLRYGSRTRDSQIIGLVLYPTELTVVVGLRRGSNIAFVRSQGGTRRANRCRERSAPLGPATSACLQAACPGVEPGLRPSHGRVHSATPTSCKKPGASAGAADSKSAGTR
jgi:hypothetical protein